MHLKCKYIRTAPCWHISLFLFQHAWMFSSQGVCHNNQGETDTHQATPAVGAQIIEVLPELQTYILTLIENMLRSYLHLAALNRVYLRVRHPGKQL